MYATLQVNHVHSPLLYFFFGKDIAAEGHYLDRSPGNSRNPMEHIGSPLTQLIKQNWEHHLETLQKTMESALHFQDSSYPHSQAQGVKLHKSAPVP